MATAVTVLDSEELIYLDFSFEVPCEIRKCSKAAEWKSVTKCCAWIILMCDDHLQEWLEYSNNGGSWICDNCDQILLGNPFVAIDKLQK